MVSNEEEIENMKLKISYAVLFVLMCSFYAFGQKSPIQYDPKFDGLRPSERPLPEKSPVILTPRDFRWVKMPKQSHERYGGDDWYFDFANVQRLPNGFARGWSRWDIYLKLVEVDCAAERFRVLKAIRLGSSSGYGQPTADMDITNVAEVNTWQNGEYKINSYSYNEYSVAAMTCIAAKDLPIQTTNSTMKKKVVRKTSKKKP
jgi:hypothetical protein